MACEVDIFATVDDVFWFLLRLTVASSIAVSFADRLDMFQVQGCSRVEDLLVRSLAR